MNDRFKTLMKILYGNKYTIIDLNIYLKKEIHQKTIYWKQL